MCRVKPSSLARRRGCHEQVSHETLLPFDNINRDDGCRQWRSYHVSSHKNSIVVVTNDYPILFLVSVFDAFDILSFVEAYFIETQSL
jgi:hypothetical protein